MFQAPISKEYKENKGVCICNGIKSKYIKMQGHSMVSGQYTDAFLLRAKLYASNGQSES